MFWRLKLLIKVLLSRLPLGYAVFRRIGIFRHGAMDRAPYALATFQAHYGRARERGLTERFVGLELGPGDSVGSAILARSVGAAATWLVDVGSFATHDMRFYVQLADVARAAGLTVPDDLNLNDLSALLASCRGRYLSTGLRDFADIPTGSVDFVWSHAVLEHVRAGELPSLIVETYRVLRPGGIASHRVDLADHLGGRLNNLRFSDDLWESRLMAESGFYTNRVRFGEMVDLFRQAGFEVEILSVDRWPAVPVSRRVLAARFRGLADEDLRVRSFDVIMRRPRETTSNEVLA